MMKDVKIGRAILTTNHPLSSYNKPVMLLDHSVYGPDDLIKDTHYGTEYSAGAAIVIQTGDSGITPAQFDAAKRFCSQSSKNGERWAWMIERNRSASKSEKENPSEYRHERIVSSAALRRAGLVKYRSKVTPSGAVLRIAYPRGKRRTGSGRVQAVLHPKTSNPPAGKIVKIYNRVEDIYASKAGMPHQYDAKCLRAKHRYHHKFVKKACVYGLPGGRILIA
jgi:hypothetical protein